MKTESINIQSRKVNRARGRLTKLIKKMLLQERGLDPERFLEAEIQSEESEVRTMKAVLGVVLVTMGIALCVSFPWGIRAATLTLAAGILLIRDAFAGRKKKVKVYLSDLVDAPELGIDVAEVVIKVFRECGKRRSDGEVRVSSASEVQGAGSGAEGQLHFGDAAFADMSDGAESIASGILEGIFSSIDIGA
jgi:hypothetical protein